MLVAELLPFANNLSSRKWSDEDIPEDVQFIRDELKSRFESLSYVMSRPFLGCLVVDIIVLNRTWDEYSSELASGHLSWTPVHESDMFWKENAVKLNDKDHADLKFVLRLLLSA